MHVMVFTVFTMVIKQRPIGKQSKMAGHYNPELVFYAGIYPITKTTLPSGFGSTGQ
jgi:hypothetical protein